MSTTDLQDNQQLRYLFALPPVVVSNSTALAVPELPPREAVTGDEEIDAVLWLRKVINIGQPAMIAKAMEAAKLITTPLKELEKRYTAHVSKASNGHFGAVLGTFGFADLEDLAKRSLTRSAQRDEALARFGTIDAIFEKTPADLACEKALRGAKKTGEWGGYEDAVADERFAKRAELLPYTLADCLHVQNHSSALYRLRQASHENAGDHWPAFQAHDDFAFRMLARIPPRSTDEALAVLEHLIDQEQMDRSETNDILRNLIGGRASSTHPSPLPQVSKPVPGTEKAKS